MKTKKTTKPTTRELVSIMVRIPGQLIMALDLEVERRKKSGVVTSRSALIREAILAASKGW